MLWLAIAVPMLSNNNDTLKQCAAGAYDSHFHALGDTLKRFGKSDSYIRLGWEGNGDWYPWAVKTNGNDAATFVEAWRRIHRIFDAAGAPVSPPRVLTPDELAELRDKVVG